MYVNFLFSSVYRIRRLEELKCKEPDGRILFIKTNGNFGSIIAKVILVKKTVAIVFAFILFNSLVGQVVFNTSYHNLGEINKE